MTIINSITFMILVTTLMSGCADNSSQNTSNNTEITDENEDGNIAHEIEFSLQSQFENYFMIGTALNKNQIFDLEPDTLSIVHKQFNALTAENEMKWESIQPMRGEFNFESADALASIVKQQNAFFVGHTLIWHAQTPDWVFYDSLGQLRTKQDLTLIMETFIATVAGRYQGQIHGWDVLNEAFNDDGTLRQSPWHQILGDDYIAEVFQLAAVYAPNAELYYNDYNLFLPAKRAGVVTMVQDLINRGIKIDGIGIQGHYALDYPDLEELEASIIAFAELGVKVMITELDVSVLPFPESAVQGADISQNIELQSQYDPYRNGLPETVNIELAERYKQLFKLFIKHSDKISRVTTWGVHDGQTWRNNWPMEGRTDYPLLINRNKQLKSWVNELADLLP